MPQSIKISFLKSLNLQNPVTDHHSPFRLNVGFVIHQSIGYSREIPYELSQIHLPPDLTLHDLAGTVRVTRTPQGLLFQMKMQADTQTECVRCLKDFLQNLSIDISELYAFSKRSVTESNLILPEDGKIDLAPLLREYMLLEIPISPLCKDDCKGLCPICGEDLNLTTCNHEEGTSDERFAKLKSLL
jgi:uncharacterized protein